MKIQTEIHDNSFSLRIVGGDVVSPANRFYTGSRPSAVTVAEVGKRSEAMRATYVVDGVEKSVEFLAVGSVVTYLEDPQSALAQA